MPENIVLDPAIQDHHPQAILGSDAQRLSRPVLPQVGRGARHMRHHVLAYESRVGTYPFNEARLIIDIGGEYSAHGAGRTDFFGERPGIDAVHPQTTVGLQKFFQGAPAAPVAGLVLIFLDDVAFQVDAGRLHIGVVDPVVAYQRIGHDQDLTLIGRIG